MELASQLAIDVSSASISAFLIAPVISVIDKAIFLNASGKTPLFKAAQTGFIQLLRNPVHFFKQPSCYLIFGVYSGTYIVANSVQSICDQTNRPWQFPKFFCSSIANISLSVMKDLYFTRHFGKGDIRPVGLLSYSLYTTRDAMSIFASFILPSKLSLTLQNTGSLSKSQSDVLAQLFTPCAMQFLSSPLHLWGMDAYNRSIVSSYKDRLKFVRIEYGKTTMARICRIFPAFGIGGVTNNYIRENARLSI